MISKEEKLARHNVACRKSYYKNLNQNRIKGRINTRNYRLKNPNKDKEYREKNKEQLNTKKREYYQLHKEEYSERRKNWRKNNKIRYRELANKYQKENPEKVKAQRIANNKIILDKNSLCAFCNSKNNLEKHHVDYSEPLKVEILCRVCHNEVHKKYPCKAKT